MLKIIKSILIVFLTIFLLANNVLAVNLDSSEEKKSSEINSESSQELNTSNSTDSQESKVSNSANVTTIKSDSNHDAIFVTNVLIITIGIVLILLAIAILIRLKN